MTLPNTDDLSVMCLCFECGFEEEVDTPRSEREMTCPQCGDPDASFVPFWKPAAP